MFTAVTGVSGGGKSTLFIDTVYKAAARKLMGRARCRPITTASRGPSNSTRSSISTSCLIERTPRSNPATYTGAFTPIRDWFAGLPEAKARLWSGRFSFNVKAGAARPARATASSRSRCTSCRMYVTCDACHGKRHNRETLEITFKDKSIAERAGHDGQRQAGDARAGRARLYPCRPAGHDAVRR